MSKSPRDEGTCLACLGREGQVGGEVLREVGAALMTGGSQAGEDLPGPFAPGGFVPTGEFAGDYRWTQGPFRPIVGGLGGELPSKGV